MNAADPKDCDELDLREVFRRSYPSYGPAWDAAIEMGIDVGRLVYNLSLTPHERLMQLHEMTRTYELLRPPGPKHT